MYHTLWFIATFNNKNRGKNRNFLAFSVAFYSGILHNVKKLIVTQNIANTQYINILTFIIQFYINYLNAANKIRTFTKWIDYTSE